MTNMYIDNQKKAILHKFKESQKNPMELIARVFNNNEKNHYHKYKIHFN